jgi:hypothetical protein
MSRITTIIKTTINPDIPLLPFLFINPQFGYSVSSITRDLHTTPKVFLKADTFPYNIQEYYWIHNGVTGSKSWYALGLLEDNIYFLYRAYTHTGFERDGHMDLWLSYKFYDIIQYAMDNTVYSIYATDIQNNISDSPISETLVNQ